MGEPAAAAGTASAALAAELQALSKEDSSAPLASGLAGRGWALGQSIDQFVASLGNVQLPACRQLIEALQGSQGPVRAVLEALDVVTDDNDASVAALRGTYDELCELLQRAEQLLLNVQARARAGASTASPRGIAAANITEAAEALRRDMAALCSPELCNSLIHAVRQLQAAQRPAGAPPHLSPWLQREFDLDLDLRSGRKSRVLVRRVPSLKYDGKWVEGLRPSLQQCVRDLSFALEDEWLSVGVLVHLFATHAPIGAAGAINAAQHKLLELVQRGLVDVAPTPELPHRYLSRFSLLNSMRTSARTIAEVEAAVGYRHLLLLEAEAAVEQRSLDSSERTGGQYTLSSSGKALRSAQLKMAPRDAPASTKPLTSQAQPPSEWCDVRYVYIEGGDCPQLTGMERLRYLRVRNNSAMSVPDSIGECSQLVHVDLSNCKSLTALPERIGDCGHLATLSLSGCQALTALPERIGDCGHLATLYLDRCVALTALPERIGDCGHLASLDLDGCVALTALPERIGDCGHLVNLYLRGCVALTALPERLGDCHQLRDLWLESCPAGAALPQRVRDLPLLDLHGVASRGPATIQSSPPAEDLSPDAETVRTSTVERAREDEARAACAMHACIEPRDLDQLSTDPNSATTADEDESNTALRSAASVRASSTRDASRSPAQAVDAAATDPAQQLKPDRAEQRLAVVLFSMVLTGMLLAAGLLCVTLSATALYIASWLPDTEPSSVVVALFVVVLVAMLLTHSKWRKAGTVGPRPPDDEDRKGQVPHGGQALAAQHSEAPADETGVRSDGASTSQGHTPHASQAASQATTTPQAAAQNVPTQVQQEDGAPGASPPGAPAVEGGNPGVATLQ